jgi:hypothetical protein
VRLAARDETVADEVARLTASPGEIVKRFKANLASLKRSRRFVPYRESRDFSRELADLLEDLKAGVTDPRAGVELTAAFFAADNAVFGRCDDSGGGIGDVFRIDACDLFVHFASRCDDKGWLSEVVRKLVEDDGYGVRDSLLTRAAGYLPEANIREMIDRLWLSAGQREGQDSRHRYHLIRELALQVKDAPLYERATNAAWPGGAVAFLLDIAAAYLEAGDSRTAFDRIGRMPEADPWKVDERDRLLLRIQRELAMPDDAAKTAWRIFRRHRSEETLATLLASIGEHRRAEVIEGESALILREVALSLTDARFLMNQDRMDEAESYLLARAAQLNGDAYDSIAPLAKRLDESGRPLLATILYRALLDSILARGQTGAYTYGVRYLKRLDLLAGQVTTWREFPSHETYKNDLLRAHGRKTSFWSRYGK